MNFISEMKFALSHKVISARIRRVVLLIALALAPALPAGAQQPAAADADRVHAGQLIEQGNFAEAVKILRALTKKNKNDFVAWHWLGVSYEHLGKTGDARSAHEKAAKLGDALFVQEIDLSAPNKLTELIEKFRMELSVAAESAESYIRLNPKMSAKKRAEWNERLEFLHDYAGLNQLKGLSIYKSSEVTTRARVLSKPEPQYTEEARRHQVIGTVVLRAIFAEDGRVRGIVAVTRLPNGLTSQAIRAARQIKFVPATKDGRPVSMWMQLEYNFNLY